MFEAGLRSSMYPFPLAARTDVGTLKEAALFPTPQLNVSAEDVS
jgi:hypothetical protein